MMCQHFSLKCDLLNENDSVLILFFFFCSALKKFGQKHNQVRTIIIAHTVGLWNANRCQVSFTICLFSREVNREKLDSQPHLIICNVGIEVLNRIVKVQTTECCKKSSSSLSKDLLWYPILFNFCHSAE